MKLNTLFLLMAQYEGRVIVPAETVCKDYFPHLTLTKFLRKVSIGEIELPLTRAERSQKSARGVHLQDLASYLDKRREIALSELRAFRRG
ncbi:pyocin activator PrtN family protein [Mesorhizobium sp.]|uniref:pyocin activator PrtN family protein n=1 Tax=Mesorhizobium sp. TaxID=1871066 RepID=UPI000FE8BD40|nr:pyocin activator PrtN family protein [Mesorhizobium sp.]RWP58163.1 MAG: Pyocin activator protein PrtN [Mesorhizobium sp.]